MNCSTLQKLVLVLGIQLLFPCLMASAQSLDIALERMSKNISSYLVEKGQEQIMIGDFDGPDGVTAGRSIQAELKKRLKELDVEVVPLGAGWKLRGEISFETRGTFSIILLKAELIDKNGKEVSGFRERVKDEKISSLEDISRLFGLTVDLRKEQDGVAEVLNKTDAGTTGATTPTTEATTDSSKESKGDVFVSRQSNLTDKIEASVAKTTFTFAENSQSIVAASTDSPFRIEVLSRPAGAAQFSSVPIVDQGGFPFAPLAANDTYKIRVYNNADHAIGVKLSIDGINSLGLSEVPQFRQDGTWYVEAKSFGTIHGWYVNPSLMKEFLVTSNGDNLQLPDASDLGTITAQFFHAWGENEPIPAIEQIAVRRAQISTTLGPAVNVNTKTVRSNFGKSLLGSISIRYSNPDDLPADAPR